MEIREQLNVTVRPARAEDVGRMTALCEQLGYPSSEEQVRRRLSGIEGDEDHAIYVAELADGQVVGWVHVYVLNLVVSDPQAHIGGLVVDETYRRCGAGRRLMQQVEAWARAKGCWAVTLRSNVVREDAHAFYESLGYRNTKTSLMFRKALSTDSWNGLNG
jgi:GNAT superfamily N-acetyltransferase